MTKRLNGMAVPSTGDAGEGGQCPSPDGTHLKRTRALLQLSQRRLARDLNLPVRWVQDLEQGRNGLTAANRLLLKTLELFPDAVKKAARVIRDEDEVQRPESAIRQDRRSA